MPKTDTRPWAFADSPQWQAFRDACDKVGLRLKAIDEWGGGRECRCQGAVLTKYAVYGYGGLVTTLMAEGFGPDGFALYFASPYAEVDQDVQRLRDLAQGLVAA